MQRKQLISKLNTLCNTLEAKYEINHGIMKLIVGESQ